MDQFGTTQSAVVIGRGSIATLARAGGEELFAREVEAGAWDHRADVAAAIERVSKNN